MTPKQELGKVPKGDIVGGGADGAEQRAFPYVNETEMTVLLPVDRVVVSSQSCAHLDSPLREYATQLCKPDLSPARVGSVGQDRPRGSRRLSETRGEDL